MIPLYLDSTAPFELHGVTNPPLDVIKNPLVYASNPQITLNDPTDSFDNTYDIENVGINPVWDATTEPSADRDGLQVGEPREIQKIITINGFVRASNLAKLNDKIAALNRSFNPVLTYASDAENSEFDIGFIPLKFAVTTSDTVNWPDGYIQQQYYVRSIQLPVGVNTKFDDFNARFQIALLTADPRRYEQTTQLAEFTGDFGLSGNTIDNSLATYPSWPIITLTFVTAPSADISLRYRDDSAPVLQLSRIVKLKANELTDAAGKTLIIDFQARMAEYTNGTDKTDAIQPDTRFFEFVPGNLAIRSANLDVDVATDIIWRRAFA